MTRRSGFTLIELTVAIAVVGLVVASFAAGLRGLDDAKSREAAGKVAAAIQTAFDQAALSGSVHRLSFEAGQPAMRLDLAAGSFSLPAVPLEVDRQGKAKEAEKAENEEEGYLSALHESARQELERLRAGPSWSPAESELGEGIEFDSPVKILAFWTDDYEGMVKTGEGALYFFPRGETQDAIFWVGETEEDAISVRVDGLAARIQTRFELLKPEDS
jgi:prepilin-type N-terminal cleavage/methylation domain-containing protein